MDSCADGLRIEGVTGRVLPAWGSPAGWVVVHLRVTRGIEIGDRPPERRDRTLRGTRVERRTTPSWAPLARHFWIPPEGRLERRRDCGDRRRRAARSGRPADVLDGDVDRRLPRGVVGVGPGHVEAAGRGRRDRPRGTAAVAPVDLGAVVAGRAVRIAVGEVGDDAGERLPGRGRDVAAVIRRTEEDEIRRVPAVDQIRDCSTDVGTSQFPVGLYAVLYVRIGFEFIRL